MTFWAFILWRELPECFINCDTFILVTDVTLWRWYHYFHFTDEETEVNFFFRYAHNRGLQRGHENYLNSPFYCTWIATFPSPLPLFYLAPVLPEKVRNLVQHHSPPPPLSLGWWMYLILSPALQLWSTHHMHPPHSRQSSSRAERESPHCPLYPTALAHSKCSC